ncbi:MAG: FAD-binding oxidoreductase [Actinobacteria bacterium]|jgi:FAD/FMN-containing dehydrogenase|nr:FAD-binding oxidoreductase [Actinomycetota bacterium]
MDLISTLRRSLGSDWIITDPEIVAKYSSDWTGRFQGNVVCVVRPTNCWQIEKTIQIARRLGIALVTQGGNTSLVGGATPVREAVVLSSEKLDDLEIDTVSKSAVVGAGVTLETLNDAARPFGLKFAVDLASRGSATIGGMISTNAGGIHVIKYGSTRHQIIGIEAVFGNSKVISRMEGLVKDNTGYDWASILCGSEGTLGVITRAIVRLVEIPLHRTVGLIALSSLDDAVELQMDLRKSFEGIDAIELMTASGIELVGKIHPTRFPLDNVTPFTLLAEVTGSQSYELELAEFLDRHPVVTDAVIRCDSQGEGLWLWRELHSEAIAREGLAHKLDVSVPLLVVSEFVRSLEDLISSGYTGISPVIFGHLGDGNIHINLLGEAIDDELDHEIFALVAGFGGSISAEHGIGRAKVSEMSLTRSPDDIEMMQALKRICDPSMILNPGVLFPDL